MDAATAPTITDWIGAISGIVAAVGGVGTLIIAIVLISKQYKALSSTVKLSEKQDEALVATTKALNDEMAHRREDRERLRRIPAEAVDMDLFQGWRKEADAKALNGVLYRSGINLNDMTARAHVANKGVGPIRDVQIDIKGKPPKCYVLDGEEVYREGSVPAVPPGKEARFYWVGAAEDDLQLKVLFTDESGARWLKHRLNGLSEVTGQE